MISLFTGADIRYPFLSITFLVSLNPFLSISIIYSSTSTSDQYDRLFKTECHVEGTSPELIHQIAVVGAMTDRLIQEAADQGVQLYLTRQLRSPAMSAVYETGMVVVEIGLTAGELWGMRAMADLLRERWPSLEVLII